MLSKIKTLFFWTILALALFSTNVAADFTLDNNSLSLELMQSQDHTFQIEITNNDPTETITLDFSYTEMIDNDNDEIILEIPEELIIDPLQSKSAEFTINVPKYMDLNHYTSTITIQEINTSETKTFDLSILVTPGVCDFGETGTDLVLKIDDPDSGDDFGPGDTIKIKAEVENVGIDDITVQLEAFLYDEDDIVESTASSKENIEEGEDEEFIFYLTIPEKNGEIDEDEDYQLFIKAFDEDNEAQNCVQEGISLDIKLEKHKIKINEDATYFTPSITSCGESTSLVVNIINLGEKDEDVYIHVESPELNIFETSDTFEIEDFNADEDNEASRNFKLEIPENIEENI